MTTKTWKGTEGPWRVDGKCIAQGHDADRSIYAVGKMGNPIWVARAYGDGVLASVNPERLANARAIAAVPQLVEALSEWVEVNICDCNYHGEVAPDPCRRCRSVALLKAAGVEVEEC